jgi:serine/threonine protein phosphatase PrpC
MTLIVAGAARATVGTRTNQEDAFEIWPSGAQAATQGGESLLAVVADGMGGHAGGEIAGKLACETFVSSFTGSAAGAGERLKLSLEKSNAAIASHAAENARLRGMGCTLVAAWLDRAGLRWISVGDSLLLLFRAPQVLRLNADHSLGAFLDDQARHNKISPAEAQSNPYRNALRSALTGKTLEIVDHQPAPYKLAAGDWIILASDGIGTLEGDEIGDIVYANRNALPAAMAEALIAAVAEKNLPDQDNTTVVVLRISEEEQASDEAPTRIVKPEVATQAAAVFGQFEDDGVATTQRIVQPPALAELFRRHRTPILAIGMGLMFLIGWLVRAALG